MYNIYKTNNNITEFEKKYNLKYLNILRLDLTEEDLYNFRYIDANKSTQYNIVKTINTPLKKIGFISRDLSIIRPSGILSMAFFECLKNYTNQFDIYFYTLCKHYIICNIFKNFAIIKNNVPPGSIAIPTNPMVLNTSFNCSPI